MLKVFTIPTLASAPSPAPDCLNDDEFFAESAVLNAFSPSCWLCARALTHRWLRRSKISALFREKLLHLVCKLMEVGRRRCDVVERIFLIISASMKRMNGPGDYVKWWIW